MNGFAPTPTVCGNYNRKGASKTSGDGLATAINKSTSSPADFPVSLFPPQGEDEERQTTAISGRKCSALLEKQSPVGLLVKMLLASNQWWSQYATLKWRAEPLPALVTETYTLRYSHENSLCLSKLSVKTLKKEATKSNRLLFQLVPSMRPTGEIGSGFALTPRPTMIEETPENFRERMNGKRANDRKNGMPNLAVQVSAMLATPSAWDCQGTHGGGQGKSLRTDIREVNGEAGTKTGLKLQPNFVEWMMGFPQNWTDLNCLSPNTEKTG